MKTRSKSLTVLAFAALCIHTVSLRAYTALKPTAVPHYGSEFETFQLSTAIRKTNATIVKFVDAKPAGELTEIDCSELDVSNFDLTNVTNMKAMFSFGIKRICCSEELYNRFQEDSSLHYTCKRVSEISLFDYNIDDAVDIADCVKLIRIIH